MAVRGRVHGAGADGAGGGVRRRLSRGPAEYRGQLSRQVLTQVIREDGRGSAPGVSVEIGGDRLLLPYFTVNIWGGTAYITGGTYANLEDTDALRDILSQCLEQNQTEGTVENYHLRYLVEDNGLYRKLAFVDMSMEQATLARVIRSYLVIALAALLVLLGIAAAASRWVTRPVERAWRQQRQFLSDASHELKTPLTVILSNAELLEEAALPEKPARWSGNIRCEAEQMRTLVEQMLTLARADNGVRPAAMEPVNFSDVATECVLSFEPVAFEAGKPLEDHVAEDVTVTGDGGPPAASDFHSAGQRREIRRPRRHHHADAGADGAAGPLNGGQPRRPHSAGASAPSF